jgi:acyl-CoA synthetase (NDP forming)
LNEVESKALLAAFHIPVAQTLIARSPMEAMLMAQQMGLPVAMKINSPDITHKSDVHGVRLNLASGQAVRSAYGEMLAEVNSRIPLGRHATPDELAGLFAYLASDEAAYFTGAAIVMDGGETAGSLVSGGGPGA